MNDSLDVGPSAPVDVRLPRPWRDWTAHFGEFCGPHAGSGIQVVSVAPVAVVSFAVSDCHRLGGRLGHWPCRFEAVSVLSYFFLVFRLVQSLC